MSGTVEDYSSGSEQKNSQGKKYFVLGRKPIFPEMSLGEMRPFGFCALHMARAVGWQQSQE